LIRLDNNNNARFSGTSLAETILYNMERKLKSFGNSQEDWTVISNRSHYFLWSDEPIMSAYKESGSGESFGNEGDREDGDYQVNTKMLATEELSIQPSSYFSNETTSITADDCQNSTYNSTCNLIEDVLPLDMQFNQGHVLSITVYSILFVFSAIGKSYLSLFDDFHEYLYILCAVLK